MTLQNLSAPLHDEPLVLPEAWSAPPRPAIPMLAAIVPVLGAVLLWLVTGSVLALMLAALGPLIAAATVVDSARSARRGRRRAEQSTETARAQVLAEVTERHQSERQRLWAQNPDIAYLTSHPEQVWRRTVAGDLRIVVGQGEVPSSVRVSGGGADERNVEVRRRASRVADSPVVLNADRGIAIVGPPMLTAAVHRALIVQLCLLYPPGQIRVRAPDGAGTPSWLRRLPHRNVDAGLTVACAPGEEADVLICPVPETGLPPMQCTSTVRVRDLRTAILEQDGQSRTISLEALGVGQAEVIVDRMVDHYAQSVPAQRCEPVLLTELLEAAPHPVTGALAAVIGESAHGPCVVDLVGDGPHAVVAGITGAGKSELLITWVASLAARHSPEQVTFLLADFKGGTAFEALTALPHVTGVITDLDVNGARRAIESLRAELRYREQRLAEAGARDLTDPRAGMPRLVVVVDEFAALLSEQPDLHAVFVDLAARGRALGIHLILGTQRITGVIRDNLLANCPLRISLRVADAADSRAVIGADLAARLPSGEAGRGVAYLRRASTGEPERVRVALCSPELIADIPARADQHALPRKPWLPELPARVTLAEAAQLDHGGDGSLILGVADEPEHQRRSRVCWNHNDRGVMVLGRAGAGKSTVLATLASQTLSPVIVPSSAEGAWDTVTALSEGAAAPGSLVVLDDLDALAARFPVEYARELLDRVELLVRSSAEAGLFIAASAQRFTGIAARVADLLPNRVILATSSRGDHVSLGGEASRFVPELPPGRGHIGYRTIQVAYVDGASIAAAQGDPAPGWWPSPGISGYVCRPTPSLRVLRESWITAGIRALSVDDYTPEQPAPERPAAETGPDVPVVLLGDAEQWQRNWRALSQIRAQNSLLIDQSCAAEFRLLTGDRALPPYCETGRSRAWLIEAGAPPVRVTVSGAPTLRRDRRLRPRAIP